LGEFWGAIAHGQPYKLEHGLFRADGSLCYVLSRGEAIFNSQEEVIKLVGTITDISDRKQLEFALEQRKQEFQTILDSAPIAIVRVDAQRCYRYINLTYESWFQLTPDDILGRSVRDVVGEQNYQGIQDGIDRVLQGERLHLESKLCLPMGQREIAATLVPDMDEQGEVQGYYAFLQDISERKLFERELAESESKFRNLVEGVKDLISR
jgi:PAS domain S-box-containing protein